MVASSLCCLVSCSYSTHTRGEGLVHKPKSLGLWKLNSCKPFNDVWRFYGDFVNPAFKSMADDDY